jgi:hypothetical protein
MKKNEGRTYRLQVEVTDDNKRAIDDFWFQERLPTRAAAIRELLRRALGLSGGRFNPKSRKRHTSKRHG